MTHAAATRTRGQKGKEGSARDTAGARHHSPAPLQNERGPHYGGGPLVTLAGPVQPQLKVGPVDDPYEREANAVAQRVTGGAPLAAAAPLPPPEMAQRQAMEEEAAQPLLVRRQVAPEEEPVQRQVAEEEEPVQRQTAEEEPVQRQTAPEEEPIQRQTMPEEEPVQRAANGNGHVSGGTAATIRSPGAGQPMAPGVRRRIEPHVGADLSGVRVHSGARAGQAAASLGARAFTHRQHIFLGRQESSRDVRLMAHEATHVVQQGAAGNTPDVQPLLGVVGEFLNDYAQQVPGYTLFTVIIGYNPLLSVRVERNATNLVQGLLGLLGPIGNYIFAKLQEYNVLQPAFDWVGGQLNRLDLSLDRIERTIQAAYDEASITYSFERNLGIVRRHFGRLYDDVVTFVRTLVDHIMEMIKEAAIGVAEGFLTENRAWDLIKKILGHDPLRDVPVTATPVEILSDFLLLIGKEEELRQMQARGTLEETANWLATQIGTFMSLLGELRGLITSAWEAIQPENLPNLATNLRDLATRVGGFLQRVWDFAITVAAKVLELIKKSLLAWLSEFVHQVPGFHLVTVIIERNPFTGERVPRTPENIIRGFITLLPNGNTIYERLAESGTIAEAGARIEGAMAALGISWPFVVGLFTGIWDSLSINDLIDPIGAFTRIRDQFGEPIARLFTFITVVLREMVTIILEMMNFPSDLLGSIISNAMQAITDIRRDPVGFILNMLRAVKAGFTNFFNNILTHLVGGLADWLFRGLRDAGIEPPTDLSLASILDLVLQVLGLTMDRIWEKLAERIGQETVDRIRGAIERLTGIWNFVRDVQERGVVAIWEYIESQISNLWNMILQKAQEWIMERIINRAIQWLLSLLDPTGIMPVINSFIAFFRAVQSAIEYLREILAIINDYVTTIASIARGAIDLGAQKLEQGLANAIPIAIGFLANQFGLGNIGEKVQEIIAGIRELIDRALDWLLDRAVSMGQAVLGMLGFGGAGEEAGSEEEVEVPPTDVESIPEGLPPEEIKRRVLDMVQSQLVSTDVSSVRAAHSILQGVVAANRDRGLRGLSVRVADQATMSVVVEASASEPAARRIAWSDIFAQSATNTNQEIEEMRQTLSVASQASYAAVVVDGRQIGALSQSGGGTHAEEALVRGASWTQAIQAAREGVETNGSSRVTLLINRTPCSSCVQWLTEAIGGAKSSLGAAASRVVFVLAATGTYRRQARMSEEDKAALKAGSQQLAARLGRPFDDVFAEQEEIWKEDLRSFSTEWVEDDGEQYSGLTALASAGWQIAGLDAGQPMTARQLELAQIAARLAEQFGWDS